MFYVLRVKQNKAITNEIKRWDGTQRLYVFCLGTGVGPNFENALIPILSRGENL